MTSLYLIDQLIALLVNRAAINPERAIYEAIKQHLRLSCDNYITLKDLHSLTKELYLGPINKKNKGVKYKSIKQIVESLSGIDGMDTRFPWKLRHKKFRNFVQSVPAININPDDEVRIDYTIKVPPYFNEIDRLSHIPNIGYLLSNAVRKRNTKNKSMKEKANIYKHSLQISKHLQFLYFQNDAEILSKLLIENLYPKYSMDLLSITKEIQRGNHNHCQAVSALELLLYFESQGSVLNDLNLSFYRQQSQNNKISSLNNINWDEVPIAIQPKWLLDRSKKSTKNRQKATKWKVAQIETFYAILKQMCASAKSLKIVDFGSGSGALGLMMAYLFPMHTVVCVECEASRVELTKKRASLSGITNMEFICDYIQNVNISFDVGIGAHLCGVATDLAQIQCFRNKASFVLLSCCNGKCCNHSNSETKEDDIITELVQYPRSKYLREQSMTFETFKELTSFSDFNFDVERFDDCTDEKEYDMYCRYSIKRKFCKIICEIDRCFAALECGKNEYKQVCLTQISQNAQIFESSPKSDVIVGVHSRF